MDVAERRIHLSKRHVEYLLQSSFLPVPLAQVVEEGESESDDARVIRVSRQIAEEFRSAFTDQLAKVGFDPDYEPTNEGRVLEELIDRFFSGNDE